MPNQTYGATPFQATVTSNSPATITYGANGPATISSTGAVTITGTGMVTLTAWQAASGNYAAGSAMTSFTVSPATPTITFSVANQTYGAAPLQLSASSNSTGTITYKLDGGPATVSGSTLTLTGAGTVTVEADQAASGNYTSSVSTTYFTMSMAATTTKLSGTVNSSNNTASLTATVSPTNPGSYSTAATGTVTFYNGGSQTGQAA